MIVGCLNDFNDVKPRHPAGTGFKRRLFQRLCQKGSQRLSKPKPHSFALETTWTPKIEGKRRQRKWPKREPLTCCVWKWMFLAMKKRKKMTKAFQPFACAGRKRQICIKCIIIVSIKVAFFAYFKWLFISYRVSSEEKCGRLWRKFLLYLSNCHRCHSLCTWKERWRGVGLSLFLH